MRFNGIAAELAIIQFSVFRLLRSALAKRPSTKILKSFVRTQGRHLFQFRNNDIFMENTVVAVLVEVWFIKYFF